MDKAIFYIELFIATAIGSSTLRHFSQLSPATNQTALVILLLVVVLWLCLFVADDRLTKWQKVDLASFRFAMFGIALAVLIGLAVPLLGR